jgi:hypothetical protein
LLIAVTGFSLGLGVAQFVMGGPALQEVSRDQVFVVCGPAVTLGIALDNLVGGFDDGTVYYILSVGTALSYAAYCCIIATAKRGLTVACVPAFHAICVFINFAAAR